MLAMIANCVRQPHQLNANQRHVHLIDIKYCEDTRPGQQLEAAQRQHAGLHKQISGKAVTWNTILVGVGRRRQEKYFVGKKALLISIKEDHTRWLKRAASPLHQKAGTERANVDLEALLWILEALKPGYDKYTDLVSRCLSSGGSN
eukprot:1161321-Pelagomonas_calceolata.AAC.8